MPGLIPLMLKPATAGTRQSVLYSPNTQPASPSSVSRPAVSPSGTPRDALQRLSLPSSFPSAQQDPPATAIQKHTRRFSCQTTPAALPIVPYTPSEWAKAVSEVKRLYLHRRYRPCSVRCSAILDNIKDTSNAEPAYLIYLNFYAAISKEMSSRALHPSSSYRATLLRQAEAHYNRAADLIQAEDSSMRRFSRLSTASSSINSPASSVGSRASTTSTRLSSPAPSVYGVEDKPAAAVTAPAKKRVTFSDMVAEPIIRPDSPTLGFDEWVAPTVPTELKSALHVPQPQPVYQPETTEAPEEEEDERRPFSFRDSELFLPETSIDRYCSVLSGLATQVAIHLEGVRAELEKPTGEDGHSSGRSTPESVASMDAESKALEIRARIDKLKQNGWRRRRFDPSRYQALRQSVLAELE
ncbi:hypothetical protein jhhlp_007124 [Lomentospora prolificans]|uniref:Uncharacterized protein n=1 Tax=Lomentospora prolificans TaxID=41688 RepID=A0A2N3N1R7_9PEZI|nr:hypothetical protein jhhlp_007124 [Lomentospora prolificans]